MRVLSLASVMISHLRSAILAVLFAIPLIAVACDKVPLLAPTGTVITLIPESPTASLNSSVNIIATVIENGTGVTSGASTKGAGTPVQNGVGTATLTTSAGADVTVSAGAQSGKVTVNVNARAGVTISSSTTNPTAGAPVTFAVSVATSANVNNVRVDFGDGSGQDLGPLTGSTNVAHNYSAPGSYRPTATAFPAGGDPESVSTTVNVGAMSVTVTGPGSTGVGTAATFTATPSSGTQVDHFTWTYDDGTVHTTTGNQDTHIFNSKGTHQVRVDVFAVGGAQGTASTAISIT